MESPQNKLEAPVFDLDAYKTFLRTVDFSLSGNDLEEKLRQFTVKRNGKDYYPTAVYDPRNTLFSNLLPEERMEGSILVDGTDTTPKSIHMFTNHRLFRDPQRIQEIVAVSAYKSIESEVPKVGADTSERVVEII